jgi:hypothetical protein
MKNTIIVAGALIALWGVFSAVRSSCGRDNRLKELWGNQAGH